MYSPSNLCDVVIHDLLGRPTIPLLRLQPELLHSTVARFKRELVTYFLRTVVLNPLQYRLSDLQWKGSSSSAPVSQDAHSSTSLVACPLPYPALGERFLDVLFNGKRVSDGCLVIDALRDLQLCVGGEKSIRVFSPDFQGTVEVHVVNSDMHASVSLRKVRGTTTLAELREAVLVTWQRQGHRLPRSIGRDFDFAVAHLQPSLNRDVQHVRISPSMEPQWSIDAIRGSFPLVECSDATSGDVVLSLHLVFFSASDGVVRIPLSATREEGSGASGESGSTTSGWIPESRTCISVASPHKVLVPLPPVLVSYRSVPDTEETCTQVVPVCSDAGAEASRCLFVAPSPERKHRVATNHHSGTSAAAELNDTSGVCSWSPSEIIRVTSHSAQTASGSVGSPKGKTDELLQAISLRMESLERRANSESQQQQSAAGDGIIEGTRTDAKQSPQLLQAQTRYYVVGRGARQSKRTVESPTRRH